MSKLKQNSHNNCYIHDPLTCKHEIKSESFPIRHPETFAETTAYKCLQCGSLIINGKRCEDCHG